MPATNKKTVPASAHGAASKPTPPKKQYVEKLTPEQQAAIPEWNAKWMRHIMSCEPMDRETARAAAIGMYAAAKLPEPIVVFVPSPRVLALAGSISAGVWYLRKDKKFAATLMGRQKPTYDTTYDTTDDATRAATDDATCATTYATTTGDISLMAKFLVGCCSRWSNMYNGGNEWGSWTCFLSFWRDVCHLKLPEHNAYKHYEDLVLSSGPRIVHEKFCMVSDRPELIRTDGENRLHCTDGPAKRWRDGWSLWYIDGVKVDEQIVMRPKSQTLQQIKDEPNAEVKRIRIERFGWDAYLAGVGARVVDQRRNDLENTSEVLVKCDDGMTVLLPTCKTGRLFSLEVPLEITTCEQAQSWLHGGSRIDQLIPATRIIGRS